MWRFIFSHLFDFIIPPRKTEKALAAIAIEELLALKTPSQHTYGAVLPYHDDRVTPLIWELKYYANKTAARLAGAALREELLAIAAEEIGKPLLIPIPMHAKRRRERGHNQTEVLCKAALHTITEAYTYAPHVIARVRNTPLQQGLQKEARLSNVHQSMQVIKPSLVQNRICVVVDDVATTGATLSEAKRALLKAGAQKVLCLALAAAL
jgi:ComF family protein